jgi:CheY-like chemotaxis protein
MDPPARVPIVALTAHVTAADRDKCLALGMDDYLGKPFRAATLAEKLALWLPALCLDSPCRPVSPPRAAPVSDTVVPAVTLFLPSEEIRNNLHELNNNLATILCHAELAGDVPLTPEEQRESLRSILSAANRACAIASALARRNREALGNSDGERMVG